MSERVHPGAQNAPAMPAEGAQIGTVKAELGNSIVLPEELLTMIALASVLGEHILTDGDPGIGKTTVAKTLARIIGGKFSRIQGSEDVTPYDITGYFVRNEDTGRSEFLPGPIFANFVLVDENGLLRTQARAGLTEAMEEKQVTVDGKTLFLPAPHSVIATENAIEDFRAKHSKPNRDRYAIGLHFPELSEADQVAISNLNHKGQLVFKEDKPTIPEVQAAVSNVAVTDKQKYYITGLVKRFRKAAAVDQQESVISGYRPFNKIMLLSQANALRRGESAISLGMDVNFVAKYVLSHRVKLDPLVVGRRYQDYAEYETLYEDVLTSITGKRAA